MINEFYLRGQLIRGTEILEDLDFKIRVDKTYQKKNFGSFTWERSDIQTSKRI